MAFIVILKDDMAASENPADIDMSRAFLVTADLSGVNCRSIINVKGAWREK